MTNYRVLYYIDNDTAIEWGILRDSAKLVQVTSANTATDIPDSQENVLDVVLIPTAQLSLFTTHIPSSKIQQLKQAIPFVIEEKIATDFEENRLFLLDVRPKQQISAVIRSCYWEPLAKTLSRLNSPAVIPDIFALPITHKHWTLLVNNRNFVLRTDTYAGLSGDEENLNYVLTTLINEGHDRPVAIDVYATAPVALKRVKIKQQFHQIEDTFTFLAQNIPEVTSFNCLRYQQAERFHPRYLTRLPLISTLSLALATILLLVGSFWQVHYLESQAKHYQQAIHSVYRQVFPHATSVTAPRIRFQRALEQQARKEISWLSVLRTVCKPLLSLNTMHLESIDYQSNQLKLVVSTTEETELIQLQSILQRSPLTVKFDRMDTAYSTSRANIYIKVGS